jgi:hypothetical protein
VEGGSRMFCCVHCAAREGFGQLADRADAPA